MITRRNPTGDLVYKVANSLHLAVLDPATQQVLWSDDVPVRAAKLGNNSAFAKGIKNALAPIEPTVPSPQPVKTPALVPVQLNSPTKLFLQLEPQSSATDPVEAEVQAGFSQSLTQSGIHKVVDAANQADLATVKPKLDPKAGLVKLGI